MISLRHRRPEKREYPPRHSKPTQVDELRRMLWRMLPDRCLTISMVSGLGGDHALTDEEKRRLDEARTRRGQAFYSDLLFTLTHQWFQPAEAEQLWNAILKHKFELSSTLNRNIGITVAAVDYLYNLSKTAEPPTIVDEHCMWEMAEAAVRDGLTHLIDLPTFCMHLNTEIKRYARFGSPVSVIIADIDGFKKINDKWGHSEGDDILRRLAVLLRQAVRDVDICARWGGEEFAVMLPETDNEGAEATAEKIRLKVADELKDRHVTVSVGVASCPMHAETSEELLEKADHAMYRSKRRGKNCITVCSHVIHPDAHSFSQKHLHDQQASHYP